MEQPQIVTHILPPAPSYLPRHTTYTAEEFREWVRREIEACSSAQRDTTHTLALLNFYHGKEAAFRQVLARATLLP